MRVPAAVCLLCLCLAGCGGGGPVTALTPTSTSLAVSLSSTSLTFNTQLTTPATFTCSGANCAAFPGAQGGGAASLGGRGATGITTIMEVTNLNDSGTGSLRACIDASGPRTCIFRVNGIIHPKSRLEFFNPYITVAGESAPGPIVLQGDLMPGDNLLMIGTHDVVVRYITGSCGLGPGHTPGPGSLGLTMFVTASGNQGNPARYNDIWDHVSIRWWDNKGFIFGSNDTGSTTTQTLQNSLLYEPSSGHPTPVMMDDTFGFAKLDTDLDVHHNMIVNFGWRAPLFNVKSGRWVSNIVFNYSAGSQYVALVQGGASIDFIDNQYTEGNLTANHVKEFKYNNTQSSDDITHGMPGPPSTYNLDNVGPNNQTVTGVANDSNQKAMTAQGDEGGGNPGPVPSGWFRSTPLPSTTFPITADAASTLSGLLTPTVGNSRHLDCHGNWVSHRDVADTRVVNQYLARGTGDFFPPPNSGPLPAKFQEPTVNPGSPCTESLSDGIPDQWKTDNGLSLTDPNLFNTVDPNVGLPYIEVYLNGLVP